MFFLYSATSLTLRSDVYVDTIYRIEITTRTRELLLEEEPEKFEVRAFDDEGTCTYTNIIIYNVYVQYTSKTSVYREKSIPMIALWCPAFSNHG